MSKPINLSDIRHLLPPSTLTKKQTKIIPARLDPDDPSERVTVNVRFDDECNNGHNTFAVTCDIHEKRHGRWVDVGGGADHETIARVFPELEPYLKWHLCSTDGPMHYVANTIYHAKEIPAETNEFWVYLCDPSINITRKLLGIFSKEDVVLIRERYPDDVIETEMRENPLAKPADLDAARRTAMWPDATANQLRDRSALLERLPALLREFKADMEELGFTY
jgi:hypothetical protein